MAARSICDVSILLYHQHLLLNLGLSILLDKILGSKLFASCLSKEIHKIVMLDLWPECW